MAVVTDKDLRSRFSFSENEIAQLHADAEKYESGEWPEGETVLIGRPCVYGERMKSITYRDTEAEVRRMDERVHEPFRLLALSSAQRLRRLILLAGSLFSCCRCRQWLQASSVAGCPLMRCSQMRTFARLMAMR